MERFRRLSGPALWVWQGLLAAIPVFGILYILGIYVYFGQAIFTEQYVGLFLGLILACTFLGISPGGTRSDTFVPWYDWLLALLGLCTGLYVAITFPTVASMFGYITPDRIIFGALALLLVLEALRRLTGWVLVTVVLVFISYNFVAERFTGALHGRTIGINDLINYLYLDTGGLLRMLGIAATIALAFILFGQILMKFGGADLLNNLAIASFGRFRGGPAKAAVIGSSLVGTVTGGPVTNVMLTGTITIPLMIKSGYQPAQAGAIEAVASSGGQIMPPVMGVAAFIMADYLGIPYAAVVKAALIPAILYYVCLFTQVDLMAARDGMRGLKRSELPAFGPVLRDSWVVFPVLGLLIYTMFVLGYPPSTAGVISSAAAIPLLLLRRDVRSGILQRLAQALIGTGRMLIEVGIVMGAAGLIVGVTGVTGLAFSMAMTLSQVGQHSLFLLLLVSAIVSIILGMGMPSVAAYALVAVLVGPAITQLGVLPMAAHLFIFYFAIVSNFTPPIALACFAAAPIARASPNHIGYAAMKLGIVAYLVPFLFVYSPTLILDGELFAVIKAVITATAGSMILAAALIGFVFRPMTAVNRWLLTCGAIALLLPLEGFPMISWTTTILGAALVIALLVREWKQVSRQPADLQRSV